MMRGCKAVLPKSGELALSGSHDKGSLQQFREPMVGWSMLAAIGLVLERRNACAQFQAEERRKNPTLQASICPGLLRLASLKGNAAHRASGFCRIHPGE